MSCSVTMNILVIKDVGSKRRYSIAFDLTGSLRSAILTLVSRARMRCGFYTKGLEDTFYNLRVRRSPFRYEADNYLELLRALGRTDLSPMPFFPLNSEAVKRARDILLAAEVNPGFIGINPGASIPIKRWPEENFARLADRLSKKGFSVGIIEGPGEKGIGSRIEELMEYSPIHIRGLPLDVMGAMISKMKLLVSNDTAILHLGVAVGTPTLGIFGPTNPIQYTPPEAHHYYIRSDLSCSPCNRLECDRERECLRRISVEAVLERVWKIVGESE